MTWPGLGLTSLAHGMCHSVWDMESGVLQRTMRGHSAQVNSLAISPDGSTIVSGAGDSKVDHSVR